MSPMVRARSWVAKKDNQPSSSSSNSSMSNSRFLTNSTTSSSSSTKNPTVVGVNNLTGSIKNNNKGSPTNTITNNDPPSSTTTTTSKKTAKANPPPPPSSSSSSSSNNNNIINGSSKPNASNLLRKFSNVSNPNNSNNNSCSVVVGGGGGSAGNLSRRTPETPATSPVNPHSGLPSTQNLIPTEKLHEILHRHQLEIALVKKEARELKQDKAFLVAQNLRLERELCAHTRSASSSGGSISAAEQRRLAAPKRRPSFIRSRTQPHEDLDGKPASVSLHSPSHSCSSSSSHPWPCCSSGDVSTPSSRSPSMHSRNTSSASLVGLTSHAPPQGLSRRPSLSTGFGGGGCGHAPDSILAQHQAGLHSRLQRLAQASGLGITGIRPLSASGGVRAEDLNRASLSASNPNSAGPSRRNSITGSGHNSHEVPLKGILKPTTPVRPVSSCAPRSNEGFQRRLSGLGYYVEEGYDSITKPPPNKPSNRPLNHNVKNMIPQTNHHHYHHHNQPSHSNNVHHHPRHHVQVPSHTIHNNHNHSHSHSHPHPPTQNHNNNMHRDQLRLGVVERGRRSSFSNFSSW